MSDTERSLSTDFNVSPYFDDYDELKKFLRILFRPGLPVQARELTQMQTILNDQVGRFSSSIYQDGSPVSGGNFSLADVNSLKLDSSIGWDQLSTLIIRKKPGRNYAVNDELLITNGEDSAIIRLGIGGTYSFSLLNNITPSGFFGKVNTENYNVNSGASGIEFEVNVKISMTSAPTDGREERPIFHVQGFTTQTETDAPMLYGEYLTGDEFVAGDEIAVYDETDDSYGTVLGVLPASFRSDALIGSVSTGTFYTNNFFVYIDQQSIPLSKYDRTVSARIGFMVSEEIVTERDDPTLLDNASGSANENAPGAHRFRIRLVLTQKNFTPGQDDLVDDLSDTDFYEIARVENGDVVGRNDRPKFSTLGKEMARQLYDVNGNFVIEPFKLTVDDKLLFSLVVKSHESVGSPTLNVIASIDNLEVTDFTNKRFTHNEIPYVIESALVPAEPDTNEFQITLSRIPSFVDFSGESLSVFDENNFQATLTPGVAYINGYEFDSLGPTRLDLENTTTDRHLADGETQSVSIYFGNYLVTKFVGGGILEEKDFEFGTVFDLIGGDPLGTTEKIGTSRLKQLNKSDNESVEVYLFDSHFNTKSVTTEATETAVGSSTVTVATGTAADVHVGAVFELSSVRHRIISLTTDTFTITPSLETAIPASTALTLEYTMQNVRQVQFTGGTSTGLFTVADSVIKDRNEDGYPETQLLETDRTRLIFNLSELNLGGISSTSHRYTKIMTQAYDTGDTANLDLNADESLWPVADDYIVYNTSSDAIVPSSDLTIDTITGELTIAGAGGGTNYIISYPVTRLSATNGASLPATVKYGNTEVASIVDTTDTFDPANGQAILPASYFDQTNKYLTTGFTSVIKVRGIYELEAGSTSTDFKTNDVTNSYYVDYGQRDEVVEHTKIALRSGYTKPTGDLLVIVDRITTASTTPYDKVYYSINSYTDLDMEVIPTIEISSGDAFSVRNSIDFRPRVEELSSVAINFNFSTYDPLVDKTFSDSVLLPNASDTSIFSCFIDYYQPRLNKLVITSDLEMRIIPGTPAISPEAPVPEDSSLVLYDIGIASYTRNKEDIESEAYDHNRYTMSDISKIDLRLQDIEKTVQLDKVEQALLSAEVRDSNDNNLFKTGVLVDSFTDNDVADVSSPDYKASIDTDNGQLRPQFDQFALSIDYLNYDENSVGHLTDDGILLVEYDDQEPIVSILNQVVASRTENVNPFAVMNWVGEMKLQPEKDFWKDVVRKPDVVTNMGGSNSAWKEIQKNASRTDWGNWKKKWTGTYGHKTTHSKSKRGIFRWRRTVNTVKTTYNVYDKQKRTGVKTTVSTKLKRKSLGDKIVDQSVIPVMRSIDIKFRGISMKPNTLVYPFFDDREVIDHIRPGIIFVADINDTQTYNLYQAAKPYQTIMRVHDGTSYETATLTHKTKSLTSLFFHVTPNDRSSTIYDVSTPSSTHETAGTLYSGGITTTNIVATTKIITQKIGGQFRLKTDPAGSVSGIFTVPAGEFKTGTRNFLLTDASTGESGDGDTSADRDFESSGMRQVVQKNIVTTRVPTVRKRRVTQERNVYRGEKTKIRRWVDPLAETFMIDGKEYPSGVYLHSVDLWFVSRDPTIPVTLQLRPSTNGYPDSTTIIPFSEVHLDPEDVTVTESPNLDNYTRFTFSTPVYLEPNEYTFVVMTNTINYEIYTSKLGEKVLDPNTGLPTNRVINEQPFAGVMFKSQNASTWTSYQEEDIMFRINRVNFKPGEYTVNLKHEFDKQQMAELAPYRVNDARFRYTEGASDDYFIYNHFQVNVPEIKDFEGVTDPLYEYQTRLVTNERDASSTLGQFRPVEINETMTREQPMIIRQNQTDSFNVRVTYGTTSNIVSPLIDLQQMNAIFIQNIVDNLEINPKTEVTITNRGSGYVANSDYFAIQDKDGKHLGQIFVETVDVGGEILTLKNPTDVGEIANNVTGDVFFVDMSAAGTGGALEASSEISPQGGIADAKYISRRVTLKSGFESQDLKVMVSAYRPKGSRVYVYYKVKAPEDTESYESRPWVLMYEDSNPNEYSTEIDDYIPLEFVTFRRRADGTVDTNTKGGSRYTADGVTHETFNMYSVKVIIASESTAKVPILQSLGAVALVTPMEPID